MIRNYFKIAWRNIRKNKAFSAINIGGLAIGMAAVILIAIWIQNELSFDRFHANEGSLYKVYNRTTGPGEIYTWDVTSGPIGQALEKDFPEVKRTSRVYWSSNRLFSYQDKNIKAKGNDVDDSFLSMFSFPLLKGKASEAFEKVNSIVITEKLAQNLFGSEDPMHKLVKIDDEETYEVTGVLKNLPSNTQFDFDYLVPLKANDKLSGVMQSWKTYTFFTYVQLKQNTNKEMFNEKIKGELMNYVPESNTEIFLHPIEKWHLYSRFENGEIAGGRIETVRLITIIGILVLLIACINFMNLSTAQSQKRADEIGIREVVGARKTGLVIQFLCESTLLSFIAGTLALGIAVISLPYFNELIEQNLSLNFLSPLFWLAFAGFMIFTGLLAGSYPAFVLTSFTPVKVLKGSIQKSTKGFNTRKILVVTQFSVGIILVISTIVIYKQIHHVQNRDTGYQINGLVEVPIEGDINKNFDPIQNELVQSGAVSEISKTGWTVTLDGSNGSGFTWQGMGQESEDLGFSIYRTSGNFINTMGLELVSGRDIDFTRFPDDSSSVLINKTALEKTGIEDPIGKTIRRNNTTSTIVGVFEDFIISSPYSNVSPMLVFGSENHNYNLLLRLNDQNAISKNLNMVEEIFKKYNAAYPFSYQFVDDQYARKFESEQQIATLSTLFAGLTIFISCLGLLGLAAYMAQNRSKEIGIRKVLGASVFKIVQMLSREFIALVLISILIAIPVSWFVMSNWLQDFSYRISLGWSSFAVASLTVMIIALLTVSFQAIKAAISNPVKSLRTE